jgi:cytochrome c oxidase subunit 2
MMLFNVKVVSAAEYEDYLATLREAGQTGDINDAYDRLQNAPGTGAQGEGSEEGDN